MLKKLLSILSCVMVVSSAMAETCPSPTEIKNDAFHGWIPYTNDNGDTLLPQDLLRFKKEVYQFISTRWIDGASEGESHCYYVTRSGQDTIAFVAKYNLVPDFSSSSWYMSGREPRCNGNLANCAFLEETNHAALQRHQ